MRETHRRFIGRIIAAVAASFALPFVASAMTVSPPTFDYDLRGGDTVLDVIQVVNDGDIAETVYATVVDFATDGSEAGTPRFLREGEDADGAGITGWITIDTAGQTMPAKGRGNFPFSINVPVDAQPGGHYGAIILSTAPPTETISGIGVATQVAVLILINVGGEVRELGSVAEFGFHNPEVWYEHLPVQFFMRFENIGNTHLRPTGDLLITDWMGRKVATVPVNEGKSGVLPMSIRRYQFGWQKAGSDGTEPGLVRELKNFAIGKHTATLVLTYGRTAPQAIMDERVFYVWPWRTMTAAGILVLLLLAALAWQQKRRARRIIARYEAAKRNGAVEQGKDPHAGI
jgi:hypothetical protein